MLLFSVLNDERNIGIDKTPLIKYALIQGYWDFSRELALLRVVVVDLVVNHQKAFPQPKGVQGCLDLVKSIMLSPKF